MSQLPAITSLVKSVLQDKTLGIYLHGSATLGGLRPASDVDVLVVITQSMRATERHHLTDGLLAISEAPPHDRPIELIAVVQTDIRPWRYPPTADYLYGEWLRDRLTAHGAPQPQQMPNLAIEITQLMAHGKTLAGPAPAQLFAPVTAADVIRASLAGIPDLVSAAHDDTRNVVLTLARVWTTLATGRIEPKDAAADWVLARLPPEHQPVLHHAKKLYLNSTYVDETWPDDLSVRVKPHVEFVCAAIKALNNQNRP
jgi:predicted nucleotidyltransferase